MKQLLIVLAISLMFISCSTNNNNFIDGVWCGHLQEKLLVPNSHGNGTATWITIKKEKDLIMCHYWIKTSDCYSFPLTYENGRMKANYNGIQIEMNLNSDNNLYVNGNEVKSLVNIVKVDSSYKTFVETEMIPFALESKNDCMIAIFGTAKTILKL